MAIKHTFVSAKADSADTTIVRPSDWNADHDIDNNTIVTAMIASGAVGTTQLAAGAVGTAQLGGDITTAGKALLDDASAAAQRTTLGLAAIAASGSGADLVDASVTTAKLATSAQSGRFLGTQVLTGSGMGSLATGTCVVHLRGIGGGAGGGGAVPGGGAGAAAGGGSGVLLDIWIGTPGVPLPTSFTFASGTGGAGGLVTPTAGTNGGDSTITINSVLYTMKGGTGGSASAGSPTDTASLPLAPPSGTSSGGVIGFGLGGVGLVVDAAVWFSGSGGGTSLGGGGVAVGGTTTGNPGQGMGGGGSGAAAQGGARAGGDGAAGGFILEQFT